MSNFDNDDQGGSGILATVPPHVIAAYEIDLAQWGLASLAPRIAAVLPDFMLPDGRVDDASVTQWLEGQSEYRERFAPVFDRRERARRGERVALLSAAQVLEYESQVQDLESYYGLPTGFIDVREALAGDDSPEELYARAALARSDAEFAYSTAEGRRVIDQMLGRGARPGHVIALYLDPSKTLPELQRATEAAQIASGASESAFSLTVEEAVALRDSGFDPEEIQQRAAAVTTAGDARFGVGGEFEALDRQQELDILRGSIPALQELERRSQRLAARFGGGGGFQAGRGGVVGLGSA